METQRLILRKYTRNDLSDFYEYISDPKVVEFEPNKPMTLQEASDTLEWRIQSDEFIAVELKTTHKMIGNVYLGKRDFNSLELGYVFNSEFWGQGYAFESCEAITDNAFSKGIHRIYAECDPENANSWKLLERLGFVREAFFRRNVYFWTDSEGKPIWKDTFVYSKLNG